MTSRRSSDASRAHDVPLIQWIVAGLAAVVVLGSFALVAHQGLQRRRAPPSFAVAVDSVVQDDAGYRAHVTVINQGGQTAVHVHVRAELAGGGGVEEATFEIDYLPPASRRHGTLHFRSDPRAGELRPRVVGWTQP